MRSNKHQSENTPIKILYGGSLPRFNIVGTHPQFHHIKRPPTGYEFVPIDTMTSDSTNSFVGGMVKLARAFRLIGPSIKLVRAIRRNGAKLIDALKFIGTRSVRSQLLIPQNAELVFLPTWPLTFSQVPWMVEIEDTTTLFAPFVWNGRTGSINLSDEPCYPAVKALLESANCRAILCHIKSTAESIPLLFKNEQLRDKIVHVPLGVALPDPPTEGAKKEDNFVDILFTNSWHQEAASFYSRGGIDLLEAFSILSEKYPNIRLCLKTRLPSDLDKRYVEMLADNTRIQVLDHFLSSEDMNGLMWNSNIFVLPAARIHVVSILGAMSYGLPVVVSDGWGIEEYVQDDWNGLVVRGRYGECSWIDSENGMLREDYSSLERANPTIIAGFVDSLSALIEDKALRQRLGQNARQDIETKFSIENWNRGLKGAFDQVLSHR